MKISDVAKVNLIGNRLLTTGAMAIISNINMNLKELNMSENLLNPRNLKKQKEIFINRKPPKDIS